LRRGWTEGAAFGPVGGRKKSWHVYDQDHDYGKKKKILQVDIPRHLHMFHPLRKEPLAVSHLPRRALRIL
jgi:hypothetical protein